MKLMFVIVLILIVKSSFAFESRKASNNKFLSSKDSKAFNNNISNEKISISAENEDKIKANSKLKSEIPIKNKSSTIQHEKSTKTLSEEDVILNLFVAI